MKSLVKLPVTILMAIVLLSCSQLNAQTASDDAVIDMVTLPYNTSTAPSDKLIFRSQSDCNNVPNAQSKKATLFAVFNWNGDYIESANEYTVDVVVTAFKTYTGNTAEDIVETFSFPQLKIHYKTPQAFAYLDITENSNIVKRFEVTATYTLVNGGVPNAAIEANLQTKVFFKNEVSYNAKGIGVSSVGTTFDGPEATFTWEGKCNDPKAIQVPNYEFQLLRLYNDGTINPTPFINSGSQEISKLSAVIDWDQALTIETGSSQKSISLTLAEGVGYYLWRVRPIGNEEEGGIGNSENWGEWSTANEPSFSQNAVINIETNQYAGNTRFVVSNFNNNLSRDKNWIFTRSFIEGGAVTGTNSNLGDATTNNPITIGEAASFANELQMVQQQQTRIKSEDKTIVGQTIYDYSGRPAMSSMAAPVQTNQLGYISKYIRDAQNNSYSADDFDTDDNYKTPAEYNTSVDATSSIGGTGNYYSNDRVIDEDNVPSASGFPFSRTLFMNDGTSKPKAQSSPGLTFQFNTGHTVNNYLGSASDVELITMFGDEAPEESSVLKSITTDPNGGVSISYISKEGNVIATCLSSTGNQKGADNLDPLASQPGVGEGLLITHGINNNVPYGNNGLQSFKNIVFGEITDLNIYYDITPKTFENSCIEFCETCDYKVTINVIDNDNPDEPVMPNGPVTLTVNPTLNNCSPTETTYSLTITNMQPGSYTVERTIESNQVNLTAIYPPNSTANTSYLNQYLQQAKADLYADYQTGWAMVVDDSGDAIDMNNDGSVDVTPGGADSDLIDIEALNLFLYGDNSDPNNIIAPNLTAFFALLGVDDSYTSDHINIKFVNEQECSEVSNVITIPYEFCNNGECPADDVNDNPDFEAYIAIYYAQVLPEITDVPTITDIMTGYAAGEFNQLVANMIDCDAYSCSDIYKCWKGIVASYEDFKSDSDLVSGLPTSVPLNGLASDMTLSLNTSDFLGMFFNCTGYEIESIKNNPTGTCTSGGYKAHAYKHFKYDIANATTPEARCTSCEESIYSAVEGDLTDFPATAQGFIDYINALPNETTFTSTEDINGVNQTLKFNAKEGFYNCIKNCDPDYVLPAFSEAGFAQGMEEECGISCDERYDGFVEDLKVVHNNFDPSLCGQTPCLSDELFETSETNVVYYSDVYYFLYTSEVATAGLDVIFPGAEFEIEIELTSVHHVSFYQADVTAEINSINGFVILNGVTSLLLPNESGTITSIIKLRAPENIIPNSNGQVDFLNFSGTYKTGNNGTINNYSSDILIDAGEPANCYLPASLNKIYCQAEAMVNECKTYCDIDVNTDGTVGTTQQKENVLNILGGAHFDIKLNCNNGCDAGYQTATNGATPVKSWDYILKIINLKLEEERANMPNNGGNWDIVTFIENSINPELIGVGGCINYDQYTTSVFVHPSVPSYVALDILPESDLPGSGLPDMAILKYYYNTAIPEGNINNLNINPIKVYCSAPRSPAPPGSEIYGPPVGLSPSEVLAANPNETVYVSIYGKLRVIDGTTNSDLVLEECTINTSWTIFTCMEAIQNSTLTCDPVCYKLVPVTGFDEDQLLEEAIVYNLQTCEDEMTLEVKRAMEPQVSAIVNAQLNLLERLYTEECINGIADDFNVSYIVNYHHYTLYYYDRAGNLVQTVPPKGVVLLPGNATRATSTAHNLKTMYRYNSLGQLIEQFTPDGNETNFWYDNKARLRFSQNAQQATGTQKMSYTKYDHLGRITEVGEMPFTAFTNEQLNDTENYPATGVGNQITKTIYTEAIDGIYYFEDDKTQRYLQNRVSRTFTDVDGDVTTLEDQVNSYYSYDPHGNVEWLVQEAYGIGKNYMAYEYDLISGSVLKVKYNEYYPDKFFHRYTYDIDKRIKTVETSTDGVFWEKDADYDYYLHGPLKRTVIGNEKVQGQDYVYTLHGWLKGINHVDHAYDPGADGSDVARDAFGMVLGYYNNDFIGETNSAYNSTNTYNVSAETGRDLYNGNIATWASTLDYDAIPMLKQETFGNHTAVARTFTYDELNRIKTATFKDFTGTTFVTNANNDYYERFAYDANGNIDTLTRNGHTDAANSISNAMDDMRYHYPNGLLNNQLGHVTEVTLDTNGDEIIAGVTTDYADDIESQLVGNYQYDAIGNLLSDVAEGIDLIEWNVYGKITRITKVTAAPYNGQIIEFLYNASGNRILKRVQPNPVDESDNILTHYVTDASGNMMATYTEVINVTEALPTTASLKLTGHMVYGSDRLGIRNTLLDIENRADNLVIPAPADKAKERIVITETIVTNTNNNFLASSNALLNFYFFKLPIGIVTSFNTEGNNVAKTFPGLGNVGVTGKNVATYEDDNGYTILRAMSFKTGASSSTTMIQKGDGTLLNTLELKNDPNAQSVFMKSPTLENVYYYFTVGYDKILRYHKIELNENKVYPNTKMYQEDDREYSKTMALIEDRRDGYSSQLFIKYIEKSEISDYGWGFYPSSLERFDLSSIDEDIVAPTNIPSLAGLGGNNFYNEGNHFNMGDIKISPDGNILTMVVNHGNVGVVNMPTTASILPFKLSGNHKNVSLIDGITAIGQQSIYEAPGSEPVGIRSFEYTSDGDAILYELNGYYTGSKIKRGFVSVTNGGLSKDMTNIVNYEYKGDIRRGANGKMYISNTVPLHIAAGGFFSTSFTIPGYIVEVSNPSSNSPSTLINSVEAYPFSGFTATGGLSLNNHIIYDLTTYFEPTPEEYGIPLAGTRGLGSKSYELKDHLSNVRAVISDIKLPFGYKLDVLNKGTHKYDIGTAKYTYVGTGGDYNIVTDGSVPMHHYGVEMLSATDYYAFGSQMPGRNFSSSTYRYGFQGQEMDNEIKGEGNSVNYKYRMCDPRLGRFFAADPLEPTYPYWSPYQFSGNRVIDAVELEGLELKLVEMILKEKLNGDIVILKITKVVIFKDLKSEITIHGKKVVGSKTMVRYRFEGQDTWHVYEIEEPIDYGTEDPLLKGLKSSANYDYTNPSMQKVKDDQKFMSNVAWWDVFGYLQHREAIRRRDEMAPDAQYETQAFLAAASLYLPMWGKDRRGMIKNGPEFSDLKIHAGKHNNKIMGGGNAVKYYNSAVKHSKNSQWTFTVSHNGINKKQHVTQLSEDQFMLTSTSMSGKRIYTHHIVDKKTLRGLGIQPSGLTIPKKIK